MMKRIAAMLCFVAMLLSLAACDRGEPEPDDSSPEETGFTFTDDLGRSVTVEDPQRVAALMGSFAEVWLQAGGTLAAVTEDAYSQRELLLSSSVRIVGTNREPDVGLLLAAKPDLVLLSANSASHLALRQRLENAGITAAYFAVDRFPDYLHMLDICTQITGRRDLYDANGLAVQKKINEILSDLPQVEEPPRVLLLRTSAGGVRVKGSGDTVTGIMLQELGCVDLADEGMMEELSLDAVKEADPDFIFVIVQGADQDAAMEQLDTLLQTNSKAWRALTAVKEEHYYVLDKQLFQYKPNARWAESYAFLVDVLYGDGEE